MTTNNASGPRGGVLSGIKVVELAHVIAGPLAGTLLADLGADVVHVEAPGTGDTARFQGPDKDGVRLWWKVSGRNKRSVTLDLRQPEGRELARELIAWADVLITNMRYSTLEKWGFDWNTLHAQHPKLVMLQISGNGATSSARNDPGFGKVGEARSGVVHLTGFPDGPPVHTGFSHGDSVTALMGAFGIASALVRRNEPDFTGEWIDIALFEPLFRLIEWQVIIADQLGTVPSRAGNQLAVAPAAVVNTFLTADEVWITVTSGTPRSVQKIAEMLGEPAEDYRTVQQQTARKERLDTLLHKWMSARTADVAIKEMADGEVVGSRVYSAADILEDPIYAEREDIISIEDRDLGSVKMQGVIPRMHQHPGSVWRTGAHLGEDNDLVLGDWLGRNAAELVALAKKGVI
ncbi:CaiB/BaiF CoA transferase family protein [Rhodococcus opacus]|uniref:CoA transferase n=1 Tax=Rhodococcus opacus TaxID=37919 RepID=A0AAX3YBU0_RHOOP|nr:CoA transferase [Rhodococcus opacus]NHU44693.1 CoA transferase [Rhodococcus sp. A14]MCZ4587743.1 CoA transferase [Rhodococcus opacus]QZS59070.1 CoA transferase [Rhodococcus opacus]RKM74353.1 CoA transferase [Rhodococcus opacus]WLF46892.1 CoA transferase [Rhodococcus opacus]